MQPPTLTLKPSFKLPINNYKAKTMRESYDLFIKAVMIGDTGVGKTSLWNRILKNNCSERYIVTICADIQTKYFNIDGHQIKLSLMDTAGQERYRFMGNLYYKEKDIVIVVFDLTKPETFEAVCRDWILEIVNHCDPRQTKLLILGNKSDDFSPKLSPMQIRNGLAKVDRCQMVDLEAQPEFTSTRSESFLPSNTLGYIYSEVSAQTGANVAESVDKMIRLIALPKLQKRQKAKHERDFGSTKLVISGKDLSFTNDQPKKCCS